MTAHRTFVVDRRERSTVVLVDDAGGSIDVKARHLPRDCRVEGAVLRVSLGKDGTPDWRSATRDEKEERRRLEDAAERIKKLGRSDAGGDVEL